MNFKKLGEKILTLAMAITIVFTSVPCLDMAETAEAASGYTLTEENLGSYTFKSGRYLQIYFVDYNSQMDPKDAVLRDEQRMHA